MSNFLLTKRPTRAKTNPFLEIPLPNIQHIVFDHYEIWKERTQYYYDSIMALADGDAQYIPSLAFAASAVVSGFCDSLGTEKDSVMRLRRDYLGHCQQMSLFLSESDADIDIDEVDDVIM